MTLLQNIKFLLGIELSALVYVPLFIPFSRA
jgi:hypothetical protein